MELCDYIEVFYNQHRNALRMDNIFDRRICDTHIARINHLHAHTKPLWGNLFAKHLDHHLRQFGV